MRTPKSEASGNGRWRGLLASFFLSGAGLILAGKTRRGILWAAVFFLGPFLLVALYGQPLVPAQSGPILLGSWLVLWGIMLFDSFKPVRALRWWIWVGLIIAALFVSELTSRTIKSCFQAFRVPTETMRPTILAGDDLLISKHAYAFHNPARGEIIVFNTRGIDGIASEKDGSQVFYLKRIVGLPGDRLIFRNGQLFVNDRLQQLGDPDHPRDYREQGSWLSSHSSSKYTVPEGSYFVLGDNSANSFDSRYWGPVRRESIIGRASKIYWPWRRAGTPR